MATKKKAVVKKAAPKKQAKPVKRAAAKSAPAKKATVVKTTSGKPGPARMSLQVYDVQDVPEGQHFYFVNGMKAKNVKELAEIMDKIEQEVFDYHVNTEKNDFYNWVRHVFADVELAEKLIGVTGPKHLQFTVYKHVADKAIKKR